MKLTVLQSDDFKVGTRAGYLFGYFSFVHPRSILDIRMITLADTALSEAYLIEEQSMPSLLTSASAGVLAGIASGSILVGAVTMAMIGRMNTQSMAHLLLVFDTGQSAFVATNSQNVEKILQKAKHTGILG